MMSVRTAASIAGAALLLAAGCSRGGDEDRAQGAAPVARIDREEQAREERNAELSAQQRRLQPQGGTRTHMLSGRIVTATEHEIVVRRDDGEEPDVRLRLAPRTPVLVGGREGGAGDLKEGAHVRAAFETVEDDRVATRIEVTAREE